MVWFMHYTQIDKHLLLHLVMPHEEFYSIFFSSIGTIFFLRDMSIEFHKKDDRFDTFMCF